MAKRTKVEFTLANGDVITGGVTTIDDKLHPLLGRGEIGMMRMGDHDVHVGSKDVGVCLNHFADDSHDPVWECAAMRDTRIGQIAMVQDAMNRVPNHPMFDEVMRVTNDELTKWDAHGETPKYYGG